MTFTGGQTWQILISGSDFSGGGIKFAIHMFTRLQLGVAQLEQLTPTSPIYNHYGTMDDDN